MQLANLALSFFAATALAQTAPIDNKFSLIELPYAANALEPVMSATTLGLHHGKHLLTYVTNLNNLLPGSGLEGLTLEEVVAKSEGPIFNNAGQLLNHNLYFTQFAPPAEGRKPSAALGTAIDRDFGSFEEFQKEFTQKGLTLFGSGWVWLSADSTGKLVITQEANGSSPVKHGLKPIFGLDVWEHAYYVDFQNRRTDHLSAVWQIIDWSVVEKRYTF